MDYSEFRFFSRMVSRIGLLVLSIVVLGGCAAAKHREQMDTFSDAWATGNYVVAAYGSKDNATETISPEDLEKMNMFDLLHLAEAVRLSGDDEFAILAYDNTEKVFRRFDEENIAEKAAGQLGAILVNDSIRAYRGNLYEAILVNSYKALSFLSVGKPELARVEFNRADDRTRRAVEFFAAQIEDQQAELQDNEEKAAEAQSIAATLESDETRNMIFEEYGNPSQWAVYPDFVNPFVTYLHGLYFLSSRQDSGDINRAVESFQRVHGMTDNPVVKEDLALAESLASGSAVRNEQPNQVWLVYENGVGPMLDEFRLDIPIFLVTQGRPNQPTYAGIALPQIKSGQSANLFLSAKVLEGDQWVDACSTVDLAEMERVLRTEYRHNFKGILGRAITSAIVNMFIQAEASDKAGILGAIITTAYAAQTNQADLRIWRGLPERWQVARLNRPESGLISLITDADVKIADLVLPDWPYTLIYIKQPTNLAMPAVRIIDLQGKHPAISSFDSQLVATDVAH